MTVILEVLVALVPSLVELAGASGGSNQGGETCSSLWLATQSIYRERWTTEESMFNPEWLSHF